MSYNDKVAIALKILYQSYEVIEFDAPEDTEMQAKLLAKVRDLLGFNPNEIEVLLSPVGD